MYLKLNFNNAKLFRNLSSKEAKETPSKTHLLGGGLEDRVHRGFKEPITVYQISNLIHILFGERPVPTLKESVSEIHQPYFEKAKESYMSYTSLTHFDSVDKTGNKKINVVKSFIRTNKAMGNSNVKNGYYTWTDINYFLKINNPELLNDLDEMLKKYGLNKTDYSFNNVLIKIYESQNFVPLFTFLKSITKNGRPIVTLYSDVLGFYQKRFDLPKSSTPITIFGYTFDSIRTFGGFEMRSRDEIKLGARNSNGIAKYENLSGVIYVPITDEDIPLLEQNVGVGTLLDGGLVTISGVVDEINVFEKENLLKVGEISVEEITY